MTHRVTPRILALTVLVLFLTGCASQFQPRYGNDGIYYDQPQRTVHHVSANPAVYPFWSLDWFYFSRHYHPYSVVVTSYDPWFYPYPGWYYGYRPGFRSHVGLAWGGYYHPWYRGGFGHIRPWQPYPIAYYPSRPHEPRIRVVDERLNETRRDGRGDRRISRLPSRAPAGAEPIATDRRVIGSGPVATAPPRTTSRSGSRRIEPSGHASARRAGPSRQQTAPPPRTRQIQRSPTPRQRPASTTRSQPSTSNRPSTNRSSAPSQNRRNANRTRERVQPP